jgi:hypothetical protein
LTAKREGQGQQQARRRRNAAIAMALGCLALLVYALIIAKLGPGVLDRPL